MEKRIKLSPHAESAIRSSIAEINTLDQLRQAKMTEARRFVDVMIQEAGFTPEDFPAYGIMGAGESAHLVPLGPDGKMIGAV